jgi:hypothetical protein
MDFRIVRGRADDRYIQIAIAVFDLLPPVDFWDDSAQVAPIDRERPGVCRCQRICLPGDTTAEPAGRIDRPEGNHRDNGGDPNDDSQRCQRRAEQVAANRLHCNDQRLAEQHQRLPIPGTPPTRRLIQRCSCSCVSTR